jgi:hypothetical protein
MQKNIGFMIRARPASADRVGAATSYLLLAGSNYRAPEVDLSYKYAGGGYLFTPCDLGVLIFPAKAWWGNWHGCSSQRLTRDGRLIGFKFGVIPDSRNTPGAPLFK